MSNKNKYKKNTKPSYKVNNKSKNTGSKKTAPEEMVDKKVPGSSVKAPYDDIRSNDIEWWNRSPMYVDAVRVPFNRVYGDPIIETDLTGYTDYHLLGNKKATPGILAIDFLPSIGATDKGSDSPVNRAFTSLYGEIYSKTTGAMQFQQADLAMFMISLSSISMLIAHAKRALGISQIYNGSNYYYPQALITAMGLDPAGIIGKQDALRSRLNDSILSFNNLKVPDFMAIYKRQYALAHNIYADEDDVQSQLYVFRPTSYYQYIDVALPNPGYCSRMAVPNTIDGLLTAISSALSAWRSSSDLGLISGSIQRAFADSDLITLDYVLSTDVILPVVDRNINYQINNAQAIILNDTSLNVTQNTVENRIVFEPKYSASTFSAVDYYYYRNESKILNSYDGNTDDEFIMESTRLMLSSISEDTSDERIYKSNTEIVTGFKIYYYREHAVMKGKLELASTSKFTNAFAMVKDSLYLAFMDQLTTLTLLSKFKHGPRVDVYTYDLEDPAPTTITHIGSIGDLYKFTTIDSSTLAGLNEAALQSVYSTNVPLRI